MTLNEFVLQYLGKKVDVDQVYGGQCVDLFRKYVSDVLEFPQPAPVIGAKNIWQNFDIDKNLYQYYDPIQNRPFGIPRKGDIVIWDGGVGGGFGHVAIFLEGGLMGFKSFDQNWPTKDVCTVTEHNYKNVYGWLRPKITNQEIETLEKEIKSLKSQITALQDSDEKWKDALKLFELPSNSKWSAYKSKVNKLLKDLKTTRKELESLKESIVGNVTRLDMKKDEKYIYSTPDLLLEVIRRIRG